MLRKCLANALHLLETYGVLIPFVRTAVERLVAGFGGLRAPLGGALSEKGIKDGFIRDFPGPNRF